MKRIFAASAILLMIIATLASCNLDKVRCDHDDLNTIESLSEVSPTCTSSGLTRGKKCTVCNEIIIPQEVIPPRGHSFDKAKCTVCDAIDPTYFSHGLAFSLSDDGLSYLVKGMGSCSDSFIVVPDEFNGKPVTGIAPRAFEYYSDLKGIVIPDTVTYIGEYAFCAYGRLKYNEFNYAKYVGSIENPYKFLILASDQNITSCSIHPDTKYIYNSAFASCASLTSITIPDSVEFIGDLAFAGCTSLTDVVISDSVTYIGNSAFKKCSSLKNLTMSASTTHIGDSAFDYCGALSSVTIPSGVTHIGKRAFAECAQLTEISIPASVEEIGQSAFVGCLSLKNISVDEGNQQYRSIDGSLYSKDSAALIQYAIGKANSSFAIPETVTHIGDEAFVGCASLESIILPDGLKSIGKDPFGSCSSLRFNEYDNAGYIGSAGNPYLYLVRAIDDGITSCEIHPDTVYIGSNAFGKTDLTSIIIPDSVRYIADFAFAWCTDLTSVYIPDTVAYVGEGAFSVCPKVTIYCQLKSRPHSWHPYWHNNESAIIWGYGGER